MEASDSPPSPSLQLVTVTQFHLKYLRPTSHHYCVTLPPPPLTIGYGCQIQLANPARVPHVGLWHNYSFNQLGHVFLGAFVENVCRRG